MNGNNLATAIFNDSCIACSSNCATCDILPEKCTSCPENYTLRGTRCSNLYNVQFRYIIDTNYTTFMANSETHALIKKIATLAGVSEDNVHIHNVTFSSVNISGEVASTNLSNASAIQTVLTGSIPDYTILSSTAVVYLGDSPAPPPPTPSSTSETGESKPNVGLIVGLSVGLSLGLLLVIFIIYKAYKSSKMSKKTRTEAYDTDVGYNRSGGSINANV